MLASQLKIFVCVKIVIMITFDITKDNIQHLKFTKILLDVATCTVWEKGS